MQVVCGHQVHVLSQHVHPVGQFTHDLVGELAGEQLQSLLQLRRPVGEVLEETIPDGEHPIVLGEEGFVVLQNGQVGVLVQTVGGVHHHDIVAARLDGGVLQHDVHLNGLLELEAVERHEGAVLHAAGIGVKVLLRAEAQLPGDGGQIADGRGVVGIHHRLGDADGVGVVHADLAQHTGAVLLPDAAVDEVVKALPRRDVTGVQPQEGGQDGAVPGIHQVTARLPRGELLEVVDRGHGVEYVDLQPRAVLHKLLHHAVDQLNLGELPVVEDKGAGGVLGQQGGQAQGGHQDGRRACCEPPAENGVPAGAAAAVPPAHAALAEGHQVVQQQGHGHQRCGAGENHGHVVAADAGIDEVAQAAAAHRGGEYRRADGVDHGDAQAGEQHGHGQG